MYGGASEPGGGGAVDEGAGDGGRTGRGPGGREGVEVGGHGAVADHQHLQDPVEVVDSCLSQQTLAPVKLYHLAKLQYVRQHLYPPGK